MEAFSFAFEQDLPCMPIRPQIHRKKNTYLKKQLVLGVKQKHTESSMQQIFRFNIFHQMAYRSETQINELQIKTVKFAF